MSQMHVVGLGSNLLVRDGGVRGTVVVLHARLNALWVEQGDRDGASDLRRRGRGLRESGAICQPCTVWPERSFLAGIPGTVGGALAMNAGGCYGAETWEIV